MARGSGRLAWHLNKLVPFGLAALVTLLAGLAMLRLDSYEHEQFHQMERTHVRAQLETVRSRLEARMAAPLLLTRGVAAGIVARGDISPAEFERMAEVLTEGDPDVHTLTVSRGTVVAMAYPVSRSGWLLGRDYRDVSSQWPTVQQAIEGRKPVLRGPVALLQGGMGLIVRNPVFLPNPKGGEDRFFGIVSISMENDSIFAHSGLGSPDLPIRVAVRSSDSLGSRSEMLYGDEGIFRGDSVAMEVSLPYGNWQIAAVPKRGWTGSGPWLSMQHLLSALMFLFIAATTFGAAAYSVQRESARQRLSQSEQRLAKEAGRFQTLLQHASDGVHIVDFSGNLIEASDSFCRMLGYTRDEAIGMNASAWDANLALGEAAKFVPRVFENPVLTTFETCHRRKDGSVFDVEVSCSPVEMEGRRILFAAARDITERKNAEKKIDRLAFFDQLTGLPNRTLLQDRLKIAMAAGLRTATYGALMFIDLDDFKTLNDTLGHSMGDLLLKQVAERLNACVRAEDTVARLGGDEFLLMVPNLDTVVAVDAAAEIETLAERVLSLLNEPYRLGDAAYRCTSSIGVTLFHGQDASSDDLLKQADLAMYKAKAAGRNGIRFFDPGMEIAVKQRVSLEADLREAIEQGQFVVHYQPQVEGEGRPTGAECLVRWIHPRRGLVCPMEFIPLAEETGLILPLGQWVLETACRQQAAWALRPETAHLTVSVNVSARQFGQKDFADLVLETIERTAADPRRLKLELTESLLVENLQDVVDKMLALKARGVGFSLDDFGTGYSSLSYLKRLPLDELKIDQSFVRDALIDPNDAAVARTVIALAHSLGLGVIAEGVESVEQREFLANSGCHAYQGYLFSRPLPIEGFESFLLEGAIQPKI